MVHEIQANNMFMKRKGYVELVNPVLTVKSNLAIARWLEATSRFNFKDSALFSDLLKSTNNCSWMDNEVPILVTGEYDDPIIPVVFEIPISDNRLQMAANV